jgi:cell division protein FtsX
MAERIAAMPEVVAYHYMSKREALERARRMFERAGRSLPPLAGNPLPASFDILLRSVADVPIVAARFYDDPLADNDPGTHNGVQARGGSTLLQASPSPQ